MSPRIPSLALAAICAWIFLSVLIFRPYWGLMDDATHLFTLLPAIERDGLIGEAWRYALRDIHWGMFRFSYPLMAYPIYRMGLALGPQAAYALNALLSLAAVLSVAHACARVLGLPLRWVLLATGAVFYQYDLLQHPSLQEKLVLLLGGLLLQQAWRPWRWWPLLLPALLLALGSKASIMIYLSMALWIFFSRQKERLFRERSGSAWLRLAAAVLLYLAALGFFSWVSAQGSYTRQFQLGKVPGNLASPAGLFFLPPVLLFFAWLLLRPAAFLRRPELLTAWIGVLAFLAIFLPWGIQAYVQSVIGPVFACLCLQLLFALAPRIPERLWQLPLLLLALVTAAYRLPVMFLRLHDVGSAVSASREWAARGISDIFMPCDEGAESMKQYLAQYGAASLRVQRLDSLQDLEGKAVFFDQALCPLPGRERALPGCAEQEELFRGSLERSFRLVRGRSCG